jgi:CRP-like cAMP-binding protein
MRIGHPLGDLLEHLPRALSHKLKRGSVVYSHQVRPVGVYALLSGQALITTSCGAGVRSVRAPDLFGYSALADENANHETVTAITPIVISWWTREQLEMAVAQRPELGTALLAYQANEYAGLEYRLNLLAFCRASERIALALRELSQALGRQREDGFFEVSGLTHELIAQYVGTTRSIVTVEIGKLRRKGMLRCSRMSLEVSPSVSDHVRPMRPHERVRRCGRTVPSVETAAFSTVRALLEGEMRAKAEEETCEAFSCPLLDGSTRRENQA